jgi:FecR protein
VPLPMTPARTRHILVSSIAMLTLATAWWLIAPTRQRIVLPDATVVRFRSDSTLTPDAGFPHPRTIHINGEFLLEVRAAAEPLTVRSRLLNFTVNGAAALHIVARAKETGEDVEVLYGDVIVRKNYTSNYPEPDHLLAGEMSMVNQSIDLMEKEKIDAAQLRVLKKAFQAQGS